MDKLSTIILIIILSVFAMGLLKLIPIESFYHKLTVDDTPHEMLKRPRGVLFDGYRFQNPKQPPKAHVCEGFIGSEATQSQMRAIDQQNYYLNVSGREAVPATRMTYDSVRPERHREINFPNVQFSWGDIINRYFSGVSDPKIWI
jgi:hypothetical protein